MTGYVLVRDSDRAFVASPGSSRSYTRDLTRARIFATREHAQADACGNETPWPLDAMLQVTR